MRRSSLYYCPIHLAFPLAALASGERVAAGIDPRRSFHLPIRLPDNLDLGAGFASVAVRMRRKQVVRLIRAAQRKRLAVFHFPNLAGGNLAGTQVADAARVPKDLRTPLWRYGDAFRQRTSGANGISSERSTLAPGNTF